MSETNMMETKSANLPAKKPATLAEILQADSMKSQWAVVLPKCLTADRLARVALTQLRKVPKLGQCNQGSFLSALMTCAELGIEPNGRHAHLIPYGQECQLIVDYKGLVELAMRSGKISRIHADVVCENDSITIHNGIIDHSINPLKERGAMVGAYAMSTFTDGTEKHEYMSKAEVDAIRSRSRAGKSGPWVTDYNEMAKKTVFRRMSKWLPLSPEIMDSIEKDADRMESLPSATQVIMEQPEVMAEGITVEAEDCIPMPETTPELPPVEAMSKADLQAEVVSHSKSEAYEEIVLAKLPPGCTVLQLPVSSLRDMVAELRKGTEQQ
jgi:recombination protein RecT